MRKRSRFVPVNNGKVEVSDILFYHSSNSFLIMIGTGKYSYCLYCTENKTTYRECMIFLGFGWIANLLLIFVSNCTFVSQTIIYLVLYNNGTSHVCTMHDYSTVRGGQGFGQYQTVVYFYSLYKSGQCIYPFLLDYRRWW